MKDGITVLSLCDGISCGYLALKRANIPIKKYFASEIKKIAIKVSQTNFPDIIQIGDVNNIFYANNILHTEVGNFQESFDLVIFGSPCQSFSIAMNTKNRIGLEDIKKSGLFYVCNRILQEVKPTYFLMQNVASMKNADKNLISSYLGVEPIKIDSQIVAPAMRKRYYWTNIPQTPLIEKENNLQDILTEGYTNRKKARCLMVSDSRPLTTPYKMMKRFYGTEFTTLIFKNQQHYLDCVEEYIHPTGNNEIFNGVRYLNQQELEKCQTIPIGYTSCLTRNEAANVLGDGWTIDVLAHLFSGIKKDSLKVFF